MPVIMHFSTFLKLLTQNTGDKIRDLSKCSQAGGFDYYRTSRDGVASLCGDSKSLEFVKMRIKAMAPENAIDRNVKIAEHCSNWLKKQTGTGKKAGKALWTSPKKIFSVHIEPEICLTQGGTNRILAVYPRDEPRINRDQAGAGILLIQKSYKAGSGPNKFGILDAFAERAYWSPTNSSQSILDHEITMIENELTKVLAL
ncbi:hypothetical protein [Mesorhizobium sp. J428]|uniref:hypothetical protein n=1 Tax=Mesorhizobium sp. J428 TaxID=2898440 RepID=UPI0021517BD7|nr:hypothetical protein [Mesorhizobium sp. J428]MCR5857300.1 hypothetical protein [Mesorhizobium sp. J428]